MAPTELLARQHIRTLDRLCTPAGIRVELLAGSVKGAQRRRVLAGLASGAVQIIVGTHALFQEVVIFRDLATTGDGVLTGLQVLDVVRRSGRPLAELAAGAMTRLPQVLRNVAVDRSAPAADALAAVAPAIAAVEAELGAAGRVVVRPSGTEPLVRVMVEAPTLEQAGRAADRLTSALRAATGTAGRPASA